MDDKKELIGKCYKRELRADDMEYICITNADIESNTADVLQLHIDKYKGKTNYGVSTFNGASLSVFTDTSLFTEITQLDFDLKYQDVLISIGRVVNDYRYR